MNTVTRKPGAFSVAIALLTVPVVCWSAPYSGGTDYKITLPGAEPSFSWQTDESEHAVRPRSEMLFKLSANSDGGDEKAQDSPTWNSDLSLRRIDFLSPGEARMQDLHKGFAYSAGVDFKHPAADSNEIEDISNLSHFISSRQLGIHFGRLGTVNYSGLDLSFRQFNDNSLAIENEQDDKELWSLGVTTGRRFSLTGLETTDPMWTVSLRGQFNLVEKPDDSVAVENQQWYLSPGLHWEHDSFRMSADVLMPFLQSGEYEEETDYRIRAKIQKRF